MFLQVDSIFDDPPRAPARLEGGLFTPGTRPTGVQAQYEQADILPNFDLLQPYRDDDKINRNLYSHPAYYLEDWKKKMEEEARKERERKKEAKKARKKNKEGKTPKRKQHVYKKIRTRAEIMREKAAKEGNLHIKDMHNRISQEFSNLPIPTSSVDLDDPPVIVDKRMPKQSSVLEPVPEDVIRETPAPEVRQAPLVPTPVASVPMTKPMSAAPRPPAPPPVPVGGPPPPAPPPINNMPSLTPSAVKVGSSSMADLIGNAKLRPAKVEEVVRKEDTRSDLLSQIRKGRELKKVQQSNIEKNKRLSGVGGIFESALDTIVGRRDAIGSDEDEDSSDSDMDWDDDDY